MKRNKKILSAFFAASLLVVSSSFAQSRDVAPVDNSYANPVATQTTTVGGDTIQTAADKSSKNNNSGKLLGMAAMGVTAIGVATNCFPANPSCKWFAAGLAASTAVTVLMGKAKNGSDATVAAVSTGPVVDSASDSSYGGSGISYTGTPEWQAAQEQIANLEAQGYKFDRTNGTVTTPDGKKLSSSTFASNASMASAGLTPLEINASNAAKAKMNADIAAKLKGADGSMYDGDLGGGGAGSATASATSADGGLAPGSLGKNNSNLGINRDPAQVAGMAKNFNGEPIGVAGDGIFSMMNKRYGVKQQGGSFLSPGP